MLSVDVAEKVLREKMAHSEAQSSYIERLINEAESEKAKPNA